MISKFSRREIFKGAISIPFLIPKFVSPKLPTIGKRTLGRTGLKVSVLGIGAVGGNPTPLFHAALDAGVNLLDTAKAYGRDEIRKRPIVKARRKEIILCSKTYINPFGKTPEKLKSLVKKDCERSLKRLGTDYLDIYHLHAAGHIAWKPEYSPFLDALEELKKEGKIRFVGISTHRGAGSYKDLIKTLDTGRIDVCLLAYNFLHPKHIFDKIFEAAKRNGTGIIAMKVTAGNIKEEYLLDRTVIWRDEFNYIRKLWKLLPRLKPHIKKGRSLAAVGLKWSLQNKNVSSALSGLKNFKELKENLEAASEAEKPLNKKEKQVLIEYKEKAGQYVCRLCGKCKGKCKAGVNLPEAGRSALYLEGYLNKEKALYLQKSLPPKERVTNCIGCQSSKNICPFGVNIHDRVKTVKEILFG